MKTNLRNKIISILMIMLNVFWAIFLFMLIYPFKVIQVDSIEILTPVVKPGESLVYRVSGCKYFSGAGTAQRKLVDHYEYFLTKESVNELSTGCFTTDIRIPIPSYVDEDTYIIHTDLSHTIFGFRRVDTHYETPEFLVER